MTVPLTLEAWPERRILRAMRGWRRGCGPLLPWFRATPFAAAHHYRNRTLPVRDPGPAHPAVAGLVDSLPAPTRETLWIFDLPGTLALWLAYHLRCRWGLGSALCWNGWYDPHGVLGGYEEIPLLLGLGLRLARRPAAGGVCLVFDAGRSMDLPGSEPQNLLDNRYTLNEEDAPSLDQLQSMGIRHVRVHTRREPAHDLASYIEYLERALTVTVSDRLIPEPQARG